MPVKTNTKSAGSKKPMRDLKTSKDVKGGIRRSGEENARRRGKGEKAMSRER